MGLGELVVNAVEAVVITETVEVNSQMIRVETPLAWRYQGKNADAGVNFVFVSVHHRLEMRLCHLAICFELKHLFENGEGRLMSLKKKNKLHKSGKAKAKDS